MYFMVIVVRRYRCYNIVVGVKVKSDSVITCVIKIIVVVVFGCLKTNVYQW